jgi:plastocyanin
MRHSQIFLVSLAIALLLFLSGDTLTVSAHGQPNRCLWHYVRRGETLSGIARMYGMSWRTLAQYNGLRNPNLIRAGSSLCIPGGHYGYQAYPSPSYGNKQPSYAPPSYHSPRHASPSYQAPGHQAPGYQAPGYQAPGYAPPATAQPSGRVVVVQVSDFAFTPSTVTIRPGDTVVWRRTGGFHNVYADDGSFGNQPNDSWTEFSHIFRAPGTVGYYCQVHGAPGGVGMAGMVIVQ